MSERPNLKEISVYEGSKQSPGGISALRGEVALKLSLKLLA